MKAAIPLGTPQRAPHFRVHLSDQELRRVRRLAWLVLAVAGLLGSGPTRAAVLFSIDGGSPAPVSDQAVLTPPGASGGPPGVVTPGSLLGLGPGDALDAMTFHYASSPSSAWFFSVDRDSVGAPGGDSDVHAEAAAGQAAGDIFLSPLDGTNRLYHNQDQLGESPASGPGTSVSGPIDELDALDMSQNPVPILFSLESGNALGVSGADLMWAGPWTVVGYTALGLAFADDIDALHYDGHDYTFSLAPGSPALATGACGGSSAADLFVSEAGSSCALFAEAADLGLLPEDNVDGIFLPEPGTLPLVALGLVAIAVMRREQAGGLAPAPAG